MESYWYWLSVLQNFWLLLIGAIAYVLGSFPTARIVAGKKVLENGTRNIGAMNVYRVTGSWWLFIVTFVVDAGKAVIAILIAWCLWKLGTYCDFQTAVMVASFCVIIGHSYSVFAKFRGGKGLASLIGIILILKWYALLIAFTVIIISILITERIMKGKFAWKFRNIFSIAGSQVYGRFIGMFIALIFLFFLMPREFFLLIPAIGLSIVMHIGRVEKYLEAEKK